MTLQRTLARIVWTFLLASCSSEPSKTPKGEAARVDANPPLHLHTIEGLVRLAGNTVQAPRRVENSTDPEFCGRMHTLDDLVVSTQNRGIQDVIVALTDVPPEKIPQFAPGRLTLDNTHCRFSPHVSVLTTGSTIEAINSDPVLHTTHLYGAIDANLGLPRKGTKMTKTVPTPGMIIVKCDVHGWMQAFIRVDAHPFHAVSGPTGSFRIPNVPTGTYVLEAWHETLGQRRKTIRVTDGETETVEIDYSLETN